MGCTDHWPHKAGEIDEENRAEMERLLEAERRQIASDLAVAREDLYRRVTSAGQLPLSDALAGTATACHISVGVAREAMWQLLYDDQLALSDDRRLKVAG